MGKSETIIMRADHSLARKLGEVARLYGTSKSEVIREYLAVCERVYPILRQYASGEEAGLLDDRVQGAVRDEITSGLDPAVLELVVKHMVNLIMIELAHRLIRSQEVE